MLPAEATASRDSLSTRVCTFSENTRGNVRGVITGIRRFPGKRWEFRVFFRELD